MHYGALDVEELGSIYESLLEQEPAIAIQPMTLQRRGRLDIIAPAPTGAETIPAPAGAEVVSTPVGSDMADIAPGTFFLRSGGARKASGSFYTPHEFVRFMVREALVPKIAALSPPHDPQPARLLGLKLLDPAMGSGHFLVEACRVLGDALLEACRSADERGWHDRIAALPDPDNSLAPYLPSRGWSETRARAICRRLVAVHCLYGCDRNHLAVVLARLSLWLESYAEGLPLTFLDHRLVHGDALTGPFLDDLGTLPVTGTPLDPLLAQGVGARLQAAMTRARHLVGALNASIGHDVGDLRRKHALKAELDATLQPLRHLACAWSGAAMRRDRHADDAWLDLARHVAEHTTWPDHLTPPQQDLLAAGAEAVSWDLWFPEAADGFAVVLGNPPWEVVQPTLTDFLAGHDAAVLDTRDPSTRATLQGRLLSRPEIAAGFEAYREGFDRLKRIVPRLYRHQRVAVGTESTSGNLDLFRLFAERAVRLSAADGTIAMLLPASFHANEGTTGIRKLYLQQTAIEWCLCFENRRRIFEIDSRFKFDILIARQPGPTVSFRCGFYLERISDAARALTYDVEFLAASGGANLTPLELRDPASLRLARKLFANAERLGVWCAERGIRLGRDLHMTGDAALFQRRGEAALVLHEGKTFHQYTDRWNTEPRYSVAPEAIRPAMAEAASRFRLAFRDIARATDERTMIACIAPPGSVFGHTATVEKTPEKRTLTDALVLCAVFNSFVFDWLVRCKATTHLSLYLLNDLPMPVLSTALQSVLADAAARLSLFANAPSVALLEHAYARTGLVPGESAELDPGSAADPQRLRATVDAAVAIAYGLSRDDYRHVLGGFSHQSWPDAPVLCLEAYDALAQPDMDDRVRAAPRRSEMVCLSPGR